MTRTHVGRDIWLRAETGQIQLGDTHWFFTPNFTVFFLIRSLTLDQMLDRGLTCDPACMDPDGIAWLGVYTCPALSREARREKVLSLAICGGCSTNFGYQCCKLLFGAGGIVFARC